MISSLATIEGILSSDNLDSLPSLNVTVLRNITVDPIEPYLRFFAYRAAQKANIKFGEYNNIYQEAVGEKPDILNSTTDFVLVFMKLETLSWSIARSFPTLTKNQIQSEKKRIVKEVLEILKGIRRQSNAVILWHSFEMPTYPTFGIWDSQTKFGQLSEIKHLNDSLLDALGETQSAYFVDLNLCINRVGSRSFFNSRYWHIGRAPYSIEALGEIALEDFKYIRSLKGKNKKCLVLDCDNILWGGILGEEGIEGIQLGNTHPGSSYYEFQQEVVNLYHRGVIIALCSKNNEEDVWEVFSKHPDMLLKKEHIATAQINWEDKATNIQIIATNLNIGLDHVVFIDDSEFEINLVKKMLPEVETIHIPKAIQSDSYNIIAACGLFDNITFSEEDRNRTADYKAEDQRKALKTQTADLKNYLQSLEMEVTVCFGDQFSIPRIAQLTQKTNQFNLTTFRYSDADIKSAIESPDVDVIYLKLSDRFGDSGIVGVCILKYSDGQASIDTFLLSCRVIGRGVENVLLSLGLKRIKQKNYKVVYGKYLPTKKNQQVQWFYKEAGFKEIISERSEANQVFQYHLNREFEKDVGYFKEIHSSILKE